VEKNLHHDFGLRIKALRDERKWSQEKLAELVGCRQPTIANIEKGKFFPRGLRLRKIAGVFRMTVSELTNTNGQRSSNQPKDDSDYDTRGIPDKLIKSKIKTLHRIKKEHDYLFTLMEQEIDRRDKAIAEYQRLLKKS
jgi:transcriptional regulator with XRE-family HTH domain